MKEKTITTIGVKFSTKFELDKLKVHQNQSYDEVIEMLLKSHSGESLTTPLNNTLRDSPVKKTGDTND